MNPADRIALHQRLADGFLDGFLHCVERQRVCYPDEWIVANDAVLMSPSFGGGEEFPLGAQIAATGLSMSDVGSMEWGLYWKHIPDFRALGPARSVVDEHGFAIWWTIGGTTRDGTELSFHEASFVQTNEQGHICRWEAFFDWNEMRPVMELVYGHGEGMTWGDAFAGIMAFLPEAADYVSEETMKNWEATGILAALSGQ